MPLRIVYKDYQLSFQTLLVKNNSSSILCRNLRKFVTKVFKRKSGMVPEIMKFDITEKLCFLQNKTFIRLNKSRRTKYTETPSYLGFKLWTSAPNYENLTSLEEFKAKIETYVAENTK